MNPLATWKTVVLLGALLAGGLAAAPAPGFDDVDGPNVRVIRHADGSRTRFTRTPDNTSLTKKKYSPDGAMTMVTIYTMDKFGNPLGCKIYDGNKNLLFKVSYGYRKTDGKLVEERMFDARVKRTDPNTGKEMPVQRICYLYDGQGNRSAPIVYNLLPPGRNHKSLEELFGVKSSALDSNPFEDEVANPNARPLNR